MAYALTYSSSQPAGLLDQDLPVIMPGLVPDVPEHGAVRLTHLVADLLTVRVAGLGQVDGDDAVLMTGHHVRRRTRQQVVAEPFGDLRPRGQRQAKIQDLEHHPALGRLRIGERHQRVGVGVGGARPGQPAGHAQRVVLGVGEQPVAHGRLLVHAPPEPTAVGERDQIQSPGIETQLRGAAEAPVCSRRRPDDHSADNDKNATRTSQCR